MEGLERSAPSAGHRPGGRRHLPLPREVHPRAARSAQPHAARRRRGRGPRPAARGDRRGRRRRPSLDDRRRGRRTAPPTPTRSSSPRRRSWCPGGEAIKNQPGPVDEIRAAIDLHGVDRHSYVVAIGGGAVLDTVGYAAATAHRGVRLIRVPTTVLAQDDSAVGVKNGINAFGKKNFVGSFAPPHAVLNDFDLLLTLSDRDWRAGISEAIKVALLKDAAFFAWIEHHARRPHRALAAGDGAARAPQRRAAPEPHRHQRRPVRARLVAAARLRPLGGAQARAALAPRAAPRRGGAIGIALDSTYSYLTGSLPHADWRRIIALFEAVELPIWHRDMATPGSGGRPGGAGRPGGVPRAPWRAAHDHAARAHRLGLRSARAG